MRTYRARMKKTVLMPRETVYKISSRWMRKYDLLSLRKDIDILLDADPDGGEVDLSLERTKKAIEEAAG